MVKINELKDALSRLRKYGREDVLEFTEPYEMAEWLQLVADLIEDVIIYNE